MKTLDKIGSLILSFFFIILGALYILWGGPEGITFPIPSVRGSLGYRLFWGFVSIGAGFVLFLEFKRTKKNNNNSKT